jgi:hypothetical protein
MQNSPEDPPRDTQDKVPSVEQVRAATIENNAKIERNEKILAESKKLIAERQKHIVEHASPRNESPAPTKERD